MLTISLNALLLNFAITAGVVFVSVVLLWLLSMRLRDVSIVDIFWGPGFGMIALVTYALADGFPARRKLLTTLTVIWALRLGGYLFWRNVGKGEDARYTALRGRVPGNFDLFALRKVFLLQGALMWLISMPVQVGQYLREPAALGLFAGAGTALWVIGLFFEAVGDWQLARFKADPANAGKVMDHGLWRYTRHPNYFGDACVWWGIFLVACDHWLGALTILAPVLFTYLLLQVTGQKLLESRLRQSKPEYQAYTERTSGFFPWPPRNG